MVWALASLQAWAHRDRILTVREDGSMPELPREYSNARLHIDLSAAAKNRDPLIFTVGAQEFRLPRCALSPVKTKSITAVRVSASWYHESGRNGLPHYILVHFPDPVQPKGVVQELGVDYLLNLQSPALLKIEKIVLHGKDSVAYQEQSIDGLCRPQRRRNESAAG
jgi:hypothetical protein